MSLDFQPKRVIFAILLKHGQELNIHTLFPFAQVTLIGIVEMLRSQYGITVEVIGIPAEGLQPVAQNARDRFPMPKQVLQ